MDPAAERSATLVLHDAELHLRRRADKRIRDALQIGALQMAGYKAREIRDLLEMTASDFKSAHTWLADAISATRD